MEKRSNVDRLLGHMISQAVSTELTNAPISYMEINSLSPKEQQYNYIIHVRIIHVQYINVFNTACMQR